MVKSLNRTKALSSNVKSKFIPRRLTQSKDGCDHKRMYKITTCLYLNYTTAKRREV